MSVERVLPPSLLVRSMPGRRVVTAGVWVRWGSAHDPAPHAGATHLVEHLTLRRCGERSRKELARLVDRLGGDVDAWTSSELMGLSVQTTVDALDDALDLLVDAVLTPTFDRLDVELERRVTLAELEMLRDDPTEQVEDALLEACWGDHPLARPVIGWQSTVAKLTPAALRRHHARLVEPGRLLVAVAGDVDPAAVARRLGRLPLAQAAEPPPLPPLAWTARHLRLDREGMDQVHARLAFPAVAVSDPATVAVGVLNRLLGVGASSRLFQRLREDEGLTYDVWSEAVLRELGGLLEIGWTCSPDAFDAALAVAREEVAAIAAGASDDEVEVARQAIARGLEMDLESTGTVCALDAAEVLERGRRLDPERMLAELAAVDGATVRALAARLLRPKAMSSALFVPSGSIARVA